MQFELCATLPLSLERVLFPILTPHFYFTYEVLRRTIGQVGSKTSS